MDFYEIFHIQCSKTMNPAAFPISATIKLTFIDLNKIFEQLLDGFLLSLVLNVHEFYYNGFIRSALFKRASNR